MKLYVHDERTGGALVDLCKSLGADVMTQDDIAAMRRQAPATPAGFFLHDVDALIFEITQPSQTMQFIIAQALLTHKPTLCVYVKNTPPRELISLIRQQPLPRSVKTFSYVQNNLPHAVQRFMLTHSSNLEDRVDIPSIKYTLRLTPRVDRYVQWRADQEHMSKADALRAMILQIAEKDKAYRQDLTLFDQE